MEGQQHESSMEMQNFSAAAVDLSQKRKQKGDYVTAPFDPRFPNANQTRNCFQNYLDYYRCSKAMAAKGKDIKLCDWYRRVFTSLCPTSWVQRWDEQRSNGTFPGKI